MARPIGVTILAVLALIGGIIGLLAGIAFFGLAALAGTVPEIPADLSPTLAAFGALFIVLGILYFVGGLVSSDSPSGAGG